MEFDRFLDDASLIDALAFLDSYDHHSPATLALPPAFVTAPVAMPQLSVPAKTQRGNGNHHLTRNRGKQKAELERLRLDVKVLESRLARLKKSSDSTSMTASSSSSSSEDDGMDDRLTSTNTLTAAWKLVAVRQYQRRKQSEIMNRDLKRALANQHKISGAIQSLFARRPPQQDMDLVYDARATVAYYMKTAESDQGDPITAVLLAQVQQLHIETEAHLTAVGLTGPNSRSLRTVSVSDPKLGTVLETSSCAPIPLSLQSAHRALVDGMAALYQDIPNVPLKSITFVEGGGVDKSYVAAVKSARCSYNLQVRAVTRVFVSADRVVFTWSSIAVVANKGVRFQGEGMVVLERSPMAPRQAVLLKTWHRMHAERVESQFGSADEIEMLQVMGMKALSQNVAGYFDALESTLLQAAVDKSGRVFVPACIAW